VVDEGRHAVQKQYHFEIFRQTRRRFSWRFVMDDKGRRRVLARSARDYRSPEKATKAINALRGTSVLTVIDRDPFELPETSFEVLAGTVPLIVDPFAVEDDLSQADVETLPPLVQQVVVEPRAPAVEQTVVEPTSSAVEQMVVEPTSPAVEPKAPGRTAAPAPAPAPATAKPTPPVRGTGRGRRTT
jgi:uncharacterized protein YegP (UPF0339 family)